MSTGNSENPNTDERGTRLRGVPWYRRPRLVGALLISLTFGPVLMFALWEAGQQAAREGRKVDVAGGNGDSESKETPEASSDSETASANSLASERFSPENAESTDLLNQLDYLARQISAGQSQCSQLKEKAQKWGQAPKSLFSPEESRKLAADSGLVRELVSILAHSRVSLADVEALSNRLERFRDVLERLRKDMREPNDAFHSELTELFGEIQSGQDRFDEDSMDILRLKDRARMPADENASLDDAIKEVRSAAARDEFERVVKEHRDNLRDADRQSVAEVESKIRAEEEGRFEKLRGELDVLREEKQRVEEETDAQKRSRKDELNKLMLERRFELEWPRMKKYLVPFTSRGYTQLIDGEFKKTSVKSPVSYRRMVYAGLLNEGSDSLESFHVKIGYGANDRDLGAFPPHVISEGTFERHFELLLSIQTFLRDFGPMMVEGNPMMGEGVKLAP